MTRNNRGLGILCQRSVWRSQEQYSSDDSCIRGRLTLITGAGVHTAGGGTPLRDSVQRLLTSLALPFTSPSDATAHAAATSNASDHTAANGSQEQDAATSNVTRNGSEMLSIRDSHDSNTMNSSTSGIVTNSSSSNSSSTSSDTSRGTSTSSSTNSTNLGSRLRKFKVVPAAGDVSGTGHAPVLIDTGLTSRREAAWLAACGPPSGVWSVVNAAALTEVVPLLTYLIRLI